MRIRRLTGVLLGLALLAGCQSGGAISGGASPVRPAVRATPAARSTTPLPARTPTPTRSAAPARSRSAHPSATTRPSRTSSPTATHTRAVPPPASGLTVVLNPGHNGADAAHPDEVNRLVPAGFGREKACETTGTDTNAGYPEHAFNWDVAKRVRTVLRAHGITVLMTRHNDHGVGPCVNQRAAIGNRPGVAAVVSIHANGAPASGHGFHVNQDSRRPDGASAKVAHESIDLGRAVHAALVSSSGLVPSTYIGSDGYFYRDDLAGLNLATNPATFLELGNMRNAGDAALQSSAAGRQRIATAIASGILAYLGR